MEIDLGIRIAQVEVLSDEQRDFLRAEQKILNQWKKAERRIKDLAANKERLTALKVKMKGAEAKALLDEQIADMDTQIAALNEKVKGLQQKHEELLNPPVEAAKDAAEVQKPKRTRRSKKAEAAAADPAAEVQKTEEVEKPKAA